MSENQENQTGKPLNVTTMNPVVILDDGETFSGIGGAQIGFVPMEWDTDEIEEQIDLGNIVTFEIGPHAKPPESADHLIELMLTICPYMEATFDESGQVIFKSGVFK